MLFAKTINFKIHMSDPVVRYACATRRLWHQDDDATSHGSSMPNETLAKKIIPALLQNFEEILHTLGSCPLPPSQVERHNRYQERVISWLERKLLWLASSASCDKRVIQENRKQLLVGVEGKGGSNTE